MKKYVPGHPNANVSVMIILHQAGTFATLFLTSAWFDLRCANCIFASYLGQICKLGCNVCLYATAIKTLNTK